MISLLWPLYGIWTYKLNWLSGYGLYDLKNFESSNPQIYQNIDLKKIYDRQSWVF